MRSSRRRLSVLSASALVLLVGACGGTGGSAPATSTVGKTWIDIGPVAPAGSSVGTISCASADFCVAPAGHSNPSDTANTGLAVTFDGTHWSASATVDPQAALLETSCPTPTFCGALDVFGGVLLFNGVTWTSPASPAPNVSLQDISCPRSSFCAAVGSSSPVPSGEREGVALTFNGVSWSAPTLVGQNTYLVSVDCTSANFCMAVGGALSTAAVQSVPSAPPAIALAFDGSQWNAPEKPSNAFDLAHVSCTTAALCIASAGASNGGLAPGDGNVLYYRGGSWSAAQRVDATALSGLSCVPSGVCVAIDQAGDVLTYDDSTWAAPLAVPNSHLLISVDCTSSSFCMALDKEGHAFVSRAI